MSNDTLDVLIRAGRRHQPVRIAYDGEVRVIELHTLGLTKAGKTAARVYQREGERNGWKLMHVDKIDMLSPLSARDVVVRPEYQPNDSQMAQILWRITE